MGSVVVVCNEKSAAATQCVHINGTLLVMEYCHTVYSQPNDLTLRLFPSLHGGVLG